MLRPNCVHADNCVCGVAIGNSDCFRSSVFVRFFTDDFVMKPDKVITSYMNGNHAWVAVIARCFSS